MTAIGDFPDSSLTLLLAALRFSADKHRNQRRKDREDSPYINHPIEVAETLCRIGQVFETATLVAAVLHDTIEDTAATPAELEGLFGRQILGLVLEVTDDKSLPKAERKRLQIVQAPHLSPAARQIKLADKICNVYDISHSPPPDWTLLRREEYLDWTAAVVAGLHGTNPALEAEYNRVLSEARRLLEIVKSSHIGSGDL
jgi:guanosine-3',5'-bis(diphosphate) 3'-pyrophosphohydrolase